jgi:hypothetical protein
MAARKRKPTKEDKLLHQASMLADRAMLVDHRSEALRQLTGSIEPAVRQRLAHEALVHQDRFLEALYAGATFGDLDEEAQMLVAATEGEAPPALAEPPLSPFLDPVVYDEDQVRRVEFEWLWNDTFFKVLVHRELGIENRAVRVDIRQHTVRGFEHVAVGTVHTPLPAPEHTHMWARLYVLRAVTYRSPYHEQIRRAVYLWCVLMAGYDVVFTELNLTDLPAWTELDHLAEDGLIELHGRPGQGQQLICAKKMLETTR